MVTLVPKGMGDPYPMLKKCALCGCGNADCRFYGISNSPFCEKCVSKLKENDSIEQEPENKDRYILTLAGQIEFPGLVRLAICPRDGVAIYKRWVDAGIARVGDHPACPYCLGKESEIYNYLI